MRNKTKEEHAHTTHENINKHISLKKKKKKNYNDSF